MWVVGAGGGVGGGEGGGGGVLREWGGWWEGGAGGQRHGQERSNPTRHLGDRGVRTHQDDRRAAAAPRHFGGDARAERDPDEDDARRGDALRCERVQDARAVCVQTLFAGPGRVAGSAVAAVLD